MTTMTMQSVPARSFVMEDVSWDYYDHTLRELEAAGRHVRVTFDDGRMELMTVGDMHEWTKKAISRLIEIYALERDIPIFPKGSVTCRRRSLGKGVEPDESYYVNTPMPPISLGELNLNKYPPPDLAIEVDISESSIPREPIYAALGVGEIWRYDGQRVTPLHRSAEGTYIAADRSIAFPDLPMEIFNRFLKLALGEGHVQAIKDFRDWARGQGKNQD